MLDEHMGPIKKIQYTDCGGQSYLHWRTMYLSFRTILVSEV